MIPTLLAEPVALILIALLAGMWLSRRTHSTVRKIFAYAPAILSVLVFATPLGANAMLKPLEDRARVAAPACSASARLDLIVVLTGGASQSARSSQDIGSLHQASFRRAIAAIELSRAIPDSRLLISGGGSTAVPEGELMRAFALQMGYPADRVMVESKSRTTSESAAAVSDILRTLKPTRVELVTSAMHMPRALASFEKAGLAVCPRPTDFQHIQVRFPTALMPQISALQKGTSVFHEYLGLLMYRLGGKA